MTVKELRDLLDDVMTIDGNGDRVVAVHSGSSQYGDATSEFTMDVSEDWVRKGKDGHRFESTFGLDEDSPRQTKVKLFCFRA